MGAPTASELLAVWERCAARTPAERARELLALASPDEPAAGLGALTAGECDGRLLDLRERLFGPKLEGAGRCGRCGEAVEFTVRTDEVRVRGSEPRSPGLLAVDGYELRFRLPTADDLAAASLEHDVPAARRALVELCVLAARRNGDEAELASLPEPVLEALAERMATADPQADVELALSCPACGYEWSAGLDPGAFVWSELDAWTRRTLHDVHVLAAAYGWSEAEILALGPRRHVYLELAAS
jgi:hypothetical protein